MFHFHRYLLEPEEGDQSAESTENSESVENQSSQMNVETVDDGSDRVKAETDGGQTVQASDTSEKSKDSNEAHVHIGSGDSITLDDNKVPNTVDNKEVVNQSTEPSGDSTVIREPDTAEVDKENAVDKTASQVMTETKGKEKKLVKLDTAKRKSEEVREAPHSPMSPVFDANDFSFEEDVMPGKKRNSPIVFKSTRIPKEFCFHLLFIAYTYLVCFPWSCCMPSYFKSSFICCVSGFIASGFQQFAVA